jgi:hypothetical protein
MKTYRSTATLVGVLYIFGTVAGVLSVVFTGPTVNASDVLSRVSANRPQIVVGGLFVLLMGFALAFIPVFVFPILKRYSEPLALGYVVFRGALETAMYIVTTISLLLLIPLSQEYLNAGAPVASHFQTLSALLRSLGELPLVVVVFSLGALIFYYLLFQTQIVPRWISVWASSPLPCTWQPAC